MAHLIPPPTAPPSPDWCVLKPGHGWDYAPTEDIFLREHGFAAPSPVAGVDRLSDAWVELFATEVAGVGLAPVQLAVHADGVLTADQARRFAAQVVDAADPLEAIQRGRPDRECHEHQQPGHA